MDEIAELTPTFQNVSFKLLDDSRQRAVAVQRSGARGHADHAHRSVRARQGPVRRNGLRADAGKTNRKFPLLLTTGQHPVAVQRRRADAPHAEQRLARRGHTGSPPARRGNAGYPRRRTGVSGQPQGRHHLTRADYDKSETGRRLYDFPQSGNRRQRRDDGIQRLGDELSRNTRSRPCRSHRPRTARAGSRISRERAKKQERLSETT